MRGAQVAQAAVLVLGVVALSGCGALGGTRLSSQAGRSAERHRHHIMVAPTSSQWPVTGSFSLSLMGHHGLAYAHGRYLSASTDEGRTWHTTTFPVPISLTRVAFTNGRSGQLFGYRVGIETSYPAQWRTTDGGQRWTATAQPASPPPYAGAGTMVWSTHGAHALFTSSPGWRTGPGPVYLRTHGNTARLSLPTGFQAYDGGFVNSLLLVVGQDAKGGAVWVSRDDGRHFSQVLQTRSPLRGLAVNGTHLTVVGGHGSPKGLGPSATAVVYRSRNGGQTWYQVYRATGQPAAFSRVMWAGQGVGYVLTGMVPMGANGNGYNAMLRTVNGGHTWTVVLRGSRFVGGIQAHLLAPWGLFAVDNGVLLQSENRGATWTPLLLGQHAQVLGIGGFGTTGTPHIVLANLGMGTYALVRTGDGSWSLGHRIPSPGGFLADFASVMTAYLSTGTRLLVTRDAGQQFHPLKTLTLTAGGGVDRVDFVSPTVGWAELSGMRSGQDRLVFTDNGGHSWIPIGPVPMLARLNFANRDSGVESTAGAWAVTRDGGRHWTRHGLPPGTVVEAAAMKPNGTVWLVTERSGTANGLSLTSVVVVSATGAVTTVPFPSSLSVTALAFPAGGKGKGGWMVANGNLYHSRNGGWTWAPVTVSIPGAVQLSVSSGS